MTLTYRTVCNGSTLADPSLLDGSTLKGMRTPLLGQRVRVSFREQARKPCTQSPPGSKNPPD